MCDCSASVDALKAEVSSLRYTQETLLGLLREIQEQVTPTIDSLKSSPIFKMLGV